MLFGSEACFACTKDPNLHESLHPFSLSQAMTAAQTTEDRELEDFYRVNVDSWADKAAHGYAVPYPSCVRVQQKIRGDSGWGKCKACKCFVEAPDEEHYVVTSIEQLSRVMWAADLFAALGERVYIHPHLFLSAREVIVAEHKLHPDVHEIENCVDVLEQRTSARLTLKKSTKASGSATRSISRAKRQHKK